MILLPYLCWGCLEHQEETMGGGGEKIQWGYNDAFQFSLFKGQQASIYALARRTLYLGNH